jgi:hypothetical protein
MIRFDELSLPCVLQPLTSPVDGFTALLRHLELTLASSYSLLLAVGTLQYHCRIANFCFNLNTFTSCTGNLLVAASGLGVTMIVLYTEYTLSLRSSENEKESETFSLSGTAFQRSKLYGRAGDRNPNLKPPIFQVRRPPGDRS